MYQRKGVNINMPSPISLMLKCTCNNLLRVSKSMSRSRLVQRAWPGRHCGGKSFFKTGTKLSLISLSQDMKLASCHPRSICSCYSSIDFGRRDQIPSAATCVVLASVSARSPVRNNEVTMLLCGTPSSICC